MANPKLSDWLALTALVIMWGSAFVFTKLALDSFTPTLIVCGRLSIGALMLVGLVFITKLRLPGPGRIWIYFVVLAVMGNALPFTLITWGQQKIDSSLAGILMAVMPLIVLVLAHLFIPGERLTPGRVSGFVLGFVGVLILLGPDAFSGNVGGGSEIIAQLAVLGGAICYSISVIIARLKPRSDPKVTAATVTFFGALFVIPPALNEDLILTDLAAAPFLALVFLGVFSTGLASILYFRIIATAGPAFLSLINYMIPVWALLAGTIILGEVLPSRFIAALALILGGIWISHRPSSRSRPTATPPLTISKQTTARISGQEQIDS